MDEEVSLSPVADDMVYGVRNTGTRRDLVVIQHVTGKSRRSTVGAGLGGRGQAWEQWERDCRGAVSLRADPIPLFFLLFQSHFLSFFLRILYSLYASWPRVSRSGSTLACRYPSPTPRVHHVARPSFLPFPVSGPLSLVLSAIGAFHNVRKTRPQ